MIKFIGGFCILAMVSIVGADDTTYTYGRKGNVRTVDCEIDLGGGVKYHRVREESDEKGVEDKRYTGYEYDLGGGVTTTNLKEENFMDRMKKLKSEEDDFGEDD